MLRVPSPNRTDAERSKFVPTRSAHRYTQRWGQVGRSWDCCGNCTGLQSRTISPEHPTSKPLFSKDGAMQSWIEHELHTVDLPDQRLNARYRLLLEQLSSKPTLS